MAGVWGNDNWAIFPWNPCSEGLSNSPSTWPGWTGSSAPTTGLFPFPVKSHVLHWSRTRPLPTYSGTSSDNLLEVKIITTLCANEIPEAVPNNLSQTLRTKLNITYVILRVSRVKILTRNPAILRLQLAFLSPYPGIWRYSTLNYTTTNYFHVVSTSLHITLAMTLTV